MCVLGRKKSNASLGTTFVCLMPESPIISTFLGETSTAAVRLNRRVSLDARTMFQLAYSFPKTSSVRMSVGIGRYFVPACLLWYGVSRGTGIETEMLFFLAAVFLTETLKRSR